MTYDRLRPNSNARQLVCLKVDSVGNFRSISVPPTLTWRPSLAEERASIRDLDKAIAANEYIALQRKQFLVRRLRYWNEYANRSKSGGITFINTADEE